MVPFANLAYVVPSAREDTIRRCGLQLRVLNCREIVVEEATSVL